MKFYEKGFAGSLVCQASKLTLKIMVFNEIYTEDDFCDEWLNNILATQAGISAPLVGAVLLDGDSGLFVFETCGDRVQKTPDRIQLQHISNVLKYTLRWQYLDIRCGNLLIVDGQLKLIDFQRIRCNTDKDDNKFVERFLEIYGG